ncbi:MAG: peptide deformylase [Deltaproteobacteria bacterium]|nr:peptide deformylase [Nannocystaceae bacterium]
MSTAPESATPKIVQAGDAVLRSRAREVTAEELATSELQALVARMIETMRAAPGVGLAAPQIGEPLRLIVLEDREDLVTRLGEPEMSERERVPFAARVFVNPVLTPVGDAKATFFEGCLSVDGYAGLVERHLEVEVQGLDEHGQSQRWRVRGWPARILQHEVDHIDGTLYIDRMHTRSFSRVEHVKARFAGRPIAEVLRTFGL